MHPFSAAFARLEAFLFCLKKWWSGDEIDPFSSTEAEDVLYYWLRCALRGSPGPDDPDDPLHDLLFSCTPSVFRRSQLQLSKSFLYRSLSSLLHGPSQPLISGLFPFAKWYQVVVTWMLNTKIALYVTHVLLLSSRLFAICYFTVSYKSWVIGVVMFHSCVVVMAKFFQDWDVFFTIVFMGIYCLRDDFVDFSNAVNVFGLTKIMFLSHILFVLEHFFMILMFYFIHRPNAWYTLAVTVGVCVLSVLGSTMRMCLLLWLKKKTASSSIASSGGDVNTC